MRSILQHAWAEIEHDIGYKSELVIPGPIRRKFSRLAGLLELADLEFSSVRKDIKRYSEKVGREINLGQLDIKLDAVSYAAFISTNKASLRSDALLCEATGHSLNHVVGERDFTQQLKRLLLLGIDNAGMLAASLTMHEDGICRLAADVCAMKEHQDEDIKSFNIGIACFYLCHLLAAKSKDAVLQEYLDMNGWADNNPHNNEFKLILLKHR